MSKQKKRGFLVKTVEKLNNSYEKSLEKNDPIYLEPLHKPEEKEEKILSCGSIDVYFLIIVLAISLFGAVMSYSASFYTAELETGDSLYYFVRHNMAADKIVSLALQAFEDTYEDKTVRATFEIFRRRFLTSQFKRGCAAEGVLFGEVCLSPMDYHFPSDLPTVNF